MGVGLSFRNILHVKFLVKYLIYNIQTKLQNNIGDSAACRSKSFVATCKATDIKKGISTPFVLAFFFFAKIVTGDV